MADPIGAAAQATGNLADYGALGVFVLCLIAALVWLVLWLRKQVTKEAAACEERAKGLEHEIVKVREKHEATLGGLCLDTRAALNEAKTCIVQNGEIIRELRRDRIQREATDRIERRSHGAAGLWLILALLPLLGGCWSTNRASVAETRGTHGGEPVHTVTITREQAESGPNVEAAITAGIQAVQGKVLGAVEALAAKIPTEQTLAAGTDKLLARLESKLPKDADTPWGALVGAAGTVFAGGTVALRESQSRKRADERHKAEREAHEQAKRELIELAKLLPPSRDLP